jgi:hypothetical protein
MLTTLYSHIEGQKAWMVCLLRLLEAKKRASDPCMPNGQGTMPAIRG